MITLALEFSSPQRSVALVGPKSNGASPALLGEASDQGSRAIQPLALVARALEHARVEREQVECIAVGLGPGSYTGIRSALALAQGWQLARDIKLLGVSSVECLAAQAQENRWFGPVRIVIDAQRNDVYLAEYEISAARCEVVHLLRLARAADVADRADSPAHPMSAFENVGQASNLPVHGASSPGDSGGRMPRAPADKMSAPHSQTCSEAIVIGPEVKRWFAEGRLLLPEARALGLLAQGRTDFVSAERLEPIYLRETKFAKAPPTRNWG